MLNTKILCKYPIKFLQDKLLGITTDSLVIFGCATGMGKSTISRLIAGSAREQDCPVVLYSLEDAPGTYATDMVRQEYIASTGEYVNMLEFSTMHSANPAQYELFRRNAREKAIAKNADGLLLQVVHEDVARNNWTVERLVASMKKEILAGYKLFVIDHLDVLCPSERHEDMARTMNELWALVVENHIALVTFSQLSSNRPRDSLCPGIDDLRGSRTKGFKATTVITLAKHVYGYYPYAGFPNASATYLRIAKQRGASTGCAVVWFDKGRYLTTYREVECNDSGTFIDGMTQAKLQKYKDKN